MIENYAESSRRTQPISADRNLLMEVRIEQTRRTIVNVNNHYEGCAVLTIDKLIDMLEPRCNERQEHRK